MKIIAFRNYFFDSLAGEYPREEIVSFFNILTEEYLKMSRLEVALNPQRKLSGEEEGKLGTALQQLKEHKPIQYITGHTQFFGLPFIVNTNVLIPRPETEELVEWVLQDLRGKNLNILDIGTGSGCIAVSLARNLPQAKITALDISEAALKTAALNAEENCVQIEFIQADVLKMEKLPAAFDVIVSNPPYVREMEKKEMQRNVLEYEPETALYVEDEDPLLFYRKISQLGAENLQPGGQLFFEINQYLGRETEALLQEKNFQTTLKKDIFGVDRMLKAVKR